ncbi:FAD/NAD(P)-binding domain-containing protein [Aulographum hederae CBS 113979]|uniref:FAD/NAD(P)-binding domain-containing protein n=1 Tax=Aulographum hederae CBS 113979 TaxID=1176131 RepID=A0A6G1GZU2_9PEZI|nr:FAD/NAD(P)-binding domain-containing protein [Aulographum hederae CBS 113979]
MIRRTLAKGKTPHVCVVGAGVAGLRCADMLLKQGVKVTIYEARDRAGGRLAQAKIGDHLVDCGPNWIHGTDNNPILDLAKKTDTTLHALGERTVTYDHLGQLIPEDEGTKYQEIMWEIIASSFQHSNDHSAEISSSESLLDYFERNADEFLKREWSDVISKKKGELERRKDMLLKVAEMWGAFVGSPVQQQSLKFMWMEQCLDGDNLFVAETYSKIFKYISEPVIAGADVQFGTKVTGICSSEDDGTAKERVTVQTVATNADDDEDSQPKSQEFDDVVVTTPLGWLKRNHKAVFDPPLPKRTTEAINSLGYGTLDKVYITFPTAFWNTSSTPPSKPEGNLPEIQKSVPNTTATTLPLHQPNVDSTANPMFGGSSAHVTAPTANDFPGFINFLRPTYASSTNPNAWLQEAMNLSCLPGTCAQPTLLFYIQGPCSVYIAGLVSRLRSKTPSSKSQILSEFQEVTAESETQIYAALLKFFTPYLALLPNYSPTSSSCTPTSFLPTLFAASELAGYGSYTNFPTSASGAPDQRLDQDVELLRAGLPERGVWFAGEHAAPFVALGTVTGAWWSGEGAAGRVVREWGLEESDGGEGKEVEGGMEELRI